MIPRQRPSTDTRALVERAQAGDRDAFGELFRIHHDDVFRAIYRRVRNRHLADDLAADTFVRAWRSLSTFTPRGGGFGAWLNTIATNLVRDLHKSARHRRELLSDGDVTARYEIDLDRRHDPEAVALANETVAELDRALATLTDWQRQVLAARFTRDLRISETARQFGTSDAVIKAAQYRATQTLRKQMGVTP